MTAPAQVGPSPQGGGPVPSTHPMRVYPASLTAEPRTRLTGRQRDILRLAANGKTNRAIGSQLGVGEEAVKSQIQKALRKLRVGDRTQAVAVALRLGLLDLGDIEIPPGANYDCRID